MKNLTLLSPLLLTASLLLPGLSSADSQKVIKAENDKPMLVYKNPTCGCCGAWIEHLEQAGFHPIAKHPKDLNNIKEEWNIEARYQSCHTAIKDGFVFEGHIPAKYIRQFLNNPPANARGLAVPAMPLGSPGMEMGRRFSPYIIYQLQNDGSQTVFAEIKEFKDQH